MVYGTIAAYQTSKPGVDHFASSLSSVPGLGDLGYIAATAFGLNVVVVVVLTVVLRAVRAPAGTDHTAPDDYHADEDDPRVEPIPELTH
jgi:SSS family solute:Na+ symporter